MSIKRFEVGKYYIYKGIKRLSGWNSAGKMDFVLDHKPHLCTKNIDEDYSSALFDEDTTHIPWAWAKGFSNWFEVTQKTPEYPLYIEILNKHDLLIHTAMTGNSISSEVKGCLNSMKLKGDCVSYITENCISYITEKEISEYCCNMWELLKDTCKEKGLIKD